MPRPFDFGRVFFPRQPGQILPEEILFQPLGNHAANVRKLVWYWDEKDFVTENIESSRKRVADAAYLHDIGKPQKFGISVNVKGKQKAEFVYSFKGHRFLATDPKQPWVESLAQGHHDYSANDICRDTYKLKSLINDLDDNHLLRAEAEKYRQILATEPLAYAHELYILEMCDQIEAEIACRFFEDKEQAESRAFMDFTITQGDTKNNFFIDPWIFNDDRPDFTLTLASWSMPFPQALREAIEKESKENAELTKQLKKAVESWWNERPKNLKAKIDQVTIKRLPKDTLQRLKTDELYTVAGKFVPNPMQEELAKQLDREKNPHPAVLLKAPTGSGKTESILFPALANDYRLFLILPTRSLLEDQKQRIDKYLIDFSNLPQNLNREISLVVDTGAQMDRWIYKNGDCDKPKVNSRRHLYKGHIVLTTLDKFLYRYFSFGDKQKSFIFPHRIHRQNSLFCFDEAHSYDEISFTNFQSLVQALYEAGRSLILMSATMPPEHTECFEYLDIIDYVDNVQNVEKLSEFQNQTLKRPYLGKRGFTWMSDITRDSQFPEKFQNHFVDIILQEWQRKANRRILTVVETVKDAVAIYKALKDKLNISTCSDDRYLFLYHGRIADQHRTELYKQIQQRDENSRPYILITTSAIEVGCDLNSEILISQICPPENLIQRTGRCNRRGDVEDAQVIVLGDQIPDFANTLTSEGWINYQQVLQSLELFDTHAITACISHSQHIDDYRVVELFSMLHDYVYGADLTCQPAHEKGLVITRSWTPSATLFYDSGEHGDWSKNLHMLPKITVPLDRLIKESDGSNVFACVDVYEKYYNQEETRYSERPLTWGWAYQKDILIRIGKSDGIQLEESYEYEADLGFVELPGIFTRWRTKGSEQKLEYKPSKDSKSAVISYIKPLNLEPAAELSH